MSHVITGEDGAVRSDHGKEHTFINKRERGAAMRKKKVAKSREFPESGGNAIDQRSCRRVSIEPGRIQLHTDVYSGVRRNHANPGVPVKSSKLKVYFRKT